MISAPKHPIETLRQATVDDLELANPLFIEAYDSIVKLMQAAARVPICVFTVLDGERQFFKSCEGLGARETPREYAFCAHAILQEDLQQMFVVPDALADDRFADNPLVRNAPHIRFYAALPIRAPNGLPVGTLALIDLKAQELTPAMRDALIHGRRLLEDQLRLLGESLRDPLTGLHNRRYLGEALEQKWHRTYSQFLPLSVLVVDVDHFKKYNDRYGHAQGDIALIAVAHCLKASCCRPGDMAIRCGGEEFLLILPNTDLNGARAFAAKLVGGVTALGLRHEDSLQGHVTISVGGTVVESRPALEIGPKRVMLAADEALYRAKDAGRNQYQLKVFESDGCLDDAVPTDHQQFT